MWPAFLWATAVQLSSRRKQWLKFLLTIRLVETYLIVKQLRCIRIRQTYFVGDLREGLPASFLSGQKSRNQSLLVSLDIDTRCHDCASFQSGLP